MALLGVGTLAFDSIETPTDRRHRVLGGSASYFAYAASYFTPVRLVGMIGRDWPEEYSALFASRQIDMQGVFHATDRDCYFWRGRYHNNYQDRDTLEIATHGFEQFDPIVPEAYRDSKFVFLAAAAPSVQLKTLAQCPARQLTFADTVDMWIEQEQPELIQLLAKIDGLMINDSEARELTGEHHLIRAGRAIQAMGPKYVVLKKGEHGCLLFTADHVAALPAFPTDEMIDPTGAGDSFAGGMMGYLTENGKTDRQSIREAILYGSVVASYTIAGFSLDGMMQMDRAKIDQRVESFRRMLSGH